MASPELDIFDEIFTLVCITFQKTMVSFKGLVKGWVEIEIINSQTSKNDTICQF